VIFQDCTAFPAGALIKASIAAAMVARSWYCQPSGPTASVLGHSMPPSLISLANRSTAATPASVVGGVVANFQPIAWAA
jgi:hypothetical protein